VDMKTIVLVALGMIAIVILPVLILLHRRSRKPTAAPPPRLAGPPGDILIDSGMGADGSPAYVSEAARRQAAINMRLDPAKRAQVEVMLGEKLGGLVAGIKESKRRYPEAYTDDEHAGLWGTGRQFYADLEKADVDKSTFGVVIAREEKDKESKS
jgi:hypothetical protein